MKWKLLAKNVNGFDISSYINNSNELLIVISNCLSLTMLLTMDSVRGTLINSSANSTYNQFAHYIVNKTNNVISCKKNFFVIQNADAQLTTCTQSDQAFDIYYR